MGYYLGGMKKKLPNWALALTGAGAWAIVWQTLTVAAVKSATLWATERWRPSAAFSMRALRSYMGVGTRVLLTSFLNTVFQNIYSFFVGNRVGLASLGYYTQGDKWSKMGVVSISQVLTASFLPTLSEVQDDPERFRRMVARINRFTGYMLFPATLGLAAMATPIFHTLFGTKWDASIVLFQMLLVRGVFTVLNSQYSNYVLSLGHARDVVWLEVLRDSTALVALAATLPVIALSTPADPVEGLRIMLWGQIGATALTWVVSAAVASRRVGATMWSFITDLAPYAALTLLIVPVMLLCGGLVGSPLAACVVEAVVGVGLYMGANRVAGSRIQEEMIGYFTGKNKL